MSDSSEREKAIRARIISWLEKHNEDLSEQDRRDLAFHMTDWTDDYDAIKAFYDDPENASDEMVNKALGCLVHIPHHLAAAAKLYTGLPVTDVFGIGATSEETAD